MSMVGNNDEAKGRMAIIREIKTEIDDCNSLIAEISERRKRAKGRIKSELGEKVADFNVLCRFADLEEDPRSDLFRLVREGFQALGIGTQVSFLDVLAPQMASPEPEEAAPKSKRGRKPKVKPEPGPFAQAQAAEDGKTFSERVKEAVEVAKSVGEPYAVIEEDFVEYENAFEPT